MLLAKDESANHAESGPFDQMGLADVTAEATSVEQMFTSAHHQLVRLERFAAFGALFATAKQPEHNKHLTFGSLYTGLQESLIVPSVYLL